MAVALRYIFYSWRLCEKSVVILAAKWRRIDWPRTCLSRAFFCTRAWISHRIAFFISCVNFSCARFFGATARSFHVRRKYWSFRRVWKNKKKEEVYILAERYELCVRGSISICARVCPRSQNSRVFRSKLQNFQSIIASTQASLQQKWAANYISLKDYNGKSVISCTCCTSAARHFGFGFHQK